MVARGDYDIHWQRGPDLFVKPRYELTGMSYFGINGVNAGFIGHMGWDVCKNSRYSRLEMG